MKASVIILGGGITGLTAAYTLEQEWKNRGITGDIVILEKDSRLGGKITSSQAEGYLIEEGPDTLSSRMTSTRKLIGELGLASQVIQPLQSGYAILHKDSLYPVEGGIFASFWGRSKAIWNTPAVSLPGKARAAMGNLLSTNHQYQDISIAQFSRGRWGREFAQVIVEPLLAGLHGGCSKRLSMQALYPQMLQKQTQRKPTTSSSNTSPFYSLKGGLSTLVNALQRQLIHTKVRTGITAKEVSFKNNDEIEVLLSTGECITASKCALATPASVSAKLLADAIPELSKLLLDIPYSSAAVVNIAVPTSASIKLPKGNGFISTEFAHSPLNACTWSSLKWPNRAPENMLLMRCFFNGLSNEELIAHCSEEEITSLATAELTTILGTDIHPIFSRVRKWIQAFPQYELGHTKRIQAIESIENSYPQLTLAGASYRGSSVPHCIKDGENAARELCNGLHSSANTVKVIQTSI